MPKISEFDLDRSIAPAEANISVNDIIRSQTTEFSSGLVLHHIDAGSQEVVRIEFEFRAGSRYQNKPLLAEFANRLLVKGTITKSAQKVAELIDCYGAFLETEIDKDRASLVLFSLNKYVDKVLPVVLDVLMNPAFSESELDLYKANQVQKMLVEQDKVSYLSRKKFNKELYLTDHPYYGHFTVEDVQHINAEDLKAFYTEHYRDKGVEVYMAGCAKPELVRMVGEMVNSAGMSFMDRPQEIRTNWIDAEVGAQHFVEKQNALQSGIRIGRFVDVYRGGEGFVGLQVLNTLFGGYFGSRLMSNIREDKGYTYGIGSALYTCDDASILFMVTEVGAEVTKASLKEIYFEMNRLVQEKVSEKELSLVKNYMGGAFLKSVDGPFELMERYKMLKRSNLGYDYYESYIESLNQVTAEQILSLAQKYLDKENFLEVVAGKNM